MLKIQLLLGVQFGRAGFHTAIVADGKEALRIALAGAPDLVVLDLGPPEVDDLTVLEQIRANEETSGVSGVLLSQVPGSHRFVMARPAAGASFSSGPGGAAR